MNIEQVPKPYNVDADPALKWGRLLWRTKRAKQAVRQSAGALMTACTQRSTAATREVRLDGEKPTRSPRGTGEVQADGG